MLEVVFSQSFYGCMRYAAFAKSEDICCLPLSLSVGDIQAGNTKDFIEIGRKQAFQQLLFSIPEEEQKRELQDLLFQTRKNLDLLVAEIRAGKPVRIWSSHNPDEACGLAYLIGLLFQPELDKAEINIVTLPQIDLQENGTAIQYVGWGEVRPNDIERLATTHTRLLTFAEKRMFANIWKHLQVENAPLRTVISGRIASVPETFYDSLIMQRLKYLPEKFMEAELVGDVLGHYPFGFGDGWIALRIEKILVDTGLLIPITKPKQGDGIYRHIVKKCLNNT